MHEAARSKVLDKILVDTREDGKAYAKERQHTAQAFTLHVEWKDGRPAEGFAWALYTGYLWADDGDAERLILIFGARAIEIEGHNLRPWSAKSAKASSTSSAKVEEQQPDAPCPFQPRGRADDFGDSLVPGRGANIKQHQGEDDDKGRHARRVQR